MYIYNIPTFWDMRKPEFNIHSFPPGHQLGIDDREIAGVGDFGLPPNFVRSSGRSQVSCKILS